MLHRSEICVLMIFALVFLALGTVVSAEETSGDPVQKLPEGPDTSRVFRLNVAPNGYPPYIIHSESGTYSGIIWDTVSEIGERLGYSTVAHQIPRKRVDRMLQDGYIDGTARAIEWTPEPERFLFTQPITRIREVFFTTADSQLAIKGLDDIEGLTIVTHLGYHYPVLQPLFESGRARRFDVTKDQDLLRFILDGMQFDAAIADESVGKWVMQQHGWSDRIKASEWAISDYGYRLMLRENWTEFAEAFNRELDRMKDSGELQRIHDRYQ